jgi:hypothetical protein
MSIDRLFPWSVESVRRGGFPAIGLFVIHVIAANGFDAYGRFPPLDIPMHFLGGVVIAYFFHRTALAAAEHGITGPFHRVTHLVLVFSLTCVATVFWEFSEFVADRYFGTHAQLGIADTMGDMLVGLCGGLAWIGIFLSVCSRSRA